MEIVNYKSKNILLSSLMNFKDIWRCSMKRMSLQRYAENQYCKRIVLSGVSLDLGGSSDSQYYKFIDCSKVTRSLYADYYSKRQDVLKIDFEKNWKLPNNQQVDSILSMNVMEHLFNYQKFLNSSYHCLKNNGKFFGSVPFLYKVHGVPYDFHRYTSQGLYSALNKAGFQNIEVTSIASGRWTAAASIAIREVRFKPFGFFLYLLAFGLDKFDKRNSKEEYAMQYFFSGVKKSKAHPKKSAKN